MACARRDSRFPPFRTERGKMGHPFVWLGWETQGPSTALGMTDFARVCTRARAPAPHSLIDGDLFGCDIIGCSVYNFLRIWVRLLPDPFLLPGGWDEHGVTEWNLGWGHCGRNRHAEVVGGAGGGGFFAQSDWARVERVDALGRQRAL